MGRRRWVALCLVVLVCAFGALAALLYLRPAWVVNQVATRLLHLDFSVGAIEWSVTEGRLLLHLQDLAYRVAAPDGSIALDHLAADIGLDWGRRITINELYLSGGRVALIQHGTVPWWRQFSGPAGERSPRESSGWEVRVRAVFLADTRMVIALEEQQRTHELVLDYVSSGVSLLGRRWVQLEGQADGNPLHMQGETLHIDAMLARRGPFEMSFDVDLAGLRLKVEGELDPFNPGGDTRVSIDADASSLPRFAAIFDIDVPKLHRASLRALLTDSADGLRLEDIAIGLETDNLRIDVSGEVLRPLQDLRPRLQVAIDIKSLQSTLASFGVDMPVDFSIDLSGQLTRPADFLQLAGAAGGITLKGFEVPGERQFGFSGATITLPKDEITGWRGPFELPLEVSAGTLLVAMEFEHRLRFYDLPVRHVGMVIRADGMDLRGRGSYKELPVEVDFGMAQRWKLLTSSVSAPGTRIRINSDFTLPYVPLDVSVKLADATALNRWLRVALPESASADASVSVRIAADHSVSLRRLDVQTVYNGRIALQMPVYDLSQPEQIDARVFADIPNTQRMGPLLDQLVNYINRQRWRRIMGDISTRAVDVVLPDRQFVPSSLRQELARHQWYQGQLDLDGAIKHSPGEFGVRNLALRFSGPELQFAASGDASYVGGRPAVDLQLSAFLRRESVPRLAIPLGVAGRVRSQGEVLLGEQFELQSGASAMRLDFSVEQAFGPRPRLVANILSDYWRAGDVLQRLPLPAARPRPAASTAPAGEPSRVLPDKRLDLDFLSRLDAFVSARGRELDFQSFSVKDWQVDVALRQGRLTIEPLRLNALGGSVFGRLERGLSGNDSTWQLDLAVDKLDLGRLRQTRERKSSGLVSAWIDLDSRGDSPRAIAVNLRGRASPYVSGLTLYGFDLDRLVPDFLRSTQRVIQSALHSQKRTGEQTEAKTLVECAAAQLLFADGMLAADRSIHVRTPHSLFLVTWLLDFTTEQQRIQMIPRVRKGIDLGGSSLARLVQVSGSLRQPSLEVDPGGLFLIGAGSAALYATGGWIYYLAWRQIDGNLTRQEGCERAGASYLHTPTGKLKLPARRGGLPTVEAPAVK